MSDFPKHRKSVTDLNRRLRSALKITTKEFRHALDSFSPTVGDKTYPERMVSYYYIQAIAKALPRANVLLELPVIGKHENRQDNHIDALVFNDHELIVAEFKRGWAPSHWKSIARDFERLRGPNVKKEIFRGFEDRPPSSAYIFLGADCWYREKAEAWKSGKRLGEWAFPESVLAANAFCDYLPVYSEEGKGYDGYYFTWAVIPFTW